MIGFRSTVWVLGIDKDIIFWDFFYIEGIVIVFGGGDGRVGRV